MYCKNCGTKLPDEGCFCPNCGCAFGKAQKVSLNLSDFSHPSDEKALKALKAIPGFSALLKAFFKIYNERQFYIQNMSSNLRLCESQLPEYYRMLPPICEKLNIAVPELYLSLDVNPNAYTYGENNPFIVITSGLLDTMPKELIPTVLAHECGHILCKHTLYRTMGDMILGGALLAVGTAGIAGLTDLVSLPLQCAMFYWMRCSEYSADRVAILHDGTSEKLIEMCMRFSGYSGDMLTDANKELFIKQAIEYKNYVADSGWNKTLEFFMMRNCSHPFNAVRAFEANSWNDSKQFEDALKIIKENSGLYLKA